MISVIGPRDSVDVVLSVAEEIGMRGQLLPSVYESPHEAIDIAREADTLSDILLFTGRVPYALAMAAGPHRAHLTFIPHGATDLYRTIGGLLLLPHHGGHIPPISLDSIHPGIVKEVFRDLALAETYHVLPLDEMLNGPAFDAEEMAEWHSTLWKHGTVAMCITCVASVHALLVKQGVPSQRIFHTRSGIREVLTRLGLWQRLSRAEAVQTAVGLVGPRNSAPAQADTDTNALVRRAAAHYAERLGGEVLGVEGDLIILRTTTDAVVRELIDRATHDLLDNELTEGTVAGFGLAITPVQAMQEASYAIKTARRDHAPYRVFREGASITEPGLVFDGIARGSQALLRQAEELGMAPLALQRLIAAFHKLDPGRFTAQELADTYGVAPRSARRIIDSLQKLGIAEPTAQRKGPGPGRPHVVYRVDLGQLIPHAE